MSTTLPPHDPGRHGWAQLLDLLALIRQHAFNPSAAPVDALIDIRDAIRQFDGEFADQE